MSKQPMPSVGGSKNQLCYCNQEHYFMGFVS